MQDTLRPSQHLSNCPGSNGIPQGGSRYSVANRLALPGCLGLVSPSQPGSRPAAERPASLCLLHSPWEGRHGRHTRPPGVRMQAERREDVLALGRRGFIACDWLPSTVPLVGLASESYSRSGHLASMALINNWTRSQARHPQTFQVQLPPPPRARQKARGGNSTGLENSLQNFSKATVR